MSEYLSKEEIRKWRSSLERITLEEYAARLGKVIQEQKHDDSLVDSVMLRSLNSMSMDKYTPKTEKIQTLAIKSFNKEKEIIAEKKASKVSSEKQVKEEKKSVVNSEKKPEKKPESVNRQEVKRVLEESSVNYSFNKNLTAREQMVFDHFLANKNTIVYAKDLAKILELPRDYVYKYIKNLRSKLNEDILQNADNGGYLLKV